MRVNLAVRSWAMSGVRESGSIPASRWVPMPDSTPHPRRARLPGLATALARSALAGGEFPSTGSVLFGTAYGSLTETAAFLENLIANDGASPKPRAFTASVHNAIASSVAQALQARGECQTFVQGGVSFVQALVAAGMQSVRADAEVLVGAVDEWTPWVGRACGEAVADEGGGVLLCASPDLVPQPMAVIVKAGFSSSADPDAWVRDELGDVKIDVLLTPDGRSVSGVPGIVRDHGPLTGGHPSAAAAAVGLSASLLAREVPPSTFDLDLVPRSVGVVARSRFGDTGLVVIEAVR